MTYTAIPVCFGAYCNPASAGWGGAGLRRRRAQERASGRRVAAGLQRVPLECLRDLDRRPACRLVSACPAGMAVYDLSHTHAHKNTVPGLPYLHIRNKEFPWGPDGLFEKKH